MGLGSASPIVGRAPAESCAASAPLPGEPLVSAAAAAASLLCSRFNGGLPTGLRVGSAEPTVRDCFNRLGRGANDNCGASAPLELSGLPSFSASDGFLSCSEAAFALFDFTNASTAGSAD